MFDLDNLLGLRPRTAADLFESIISALQVMNFVQRYQQIGPGVPNRHKDGSKWSGADVRAMNAKNGVGRPPRIRQLARAA